MLGAVFGARPARARATRSLGLFTPDDAVVEQAREIWWLFAALMPLNGAVFALDGILIGAGDTRFLMWGMLAASAVYVPVALLALDQRLGDPRRVVRPGGADRRPARDVRRALRGHALGATRVRPTMMPPMRRLAALLTLLVLLAAAPAALAADTTGRRRRRVRPAARSPRRRETPVPTAAPTVEEQSDTDRTLLFAIGGGLLVLFVVIGYVITRDARRTCPRRAPRRAAAPPLREQGPHQHAQADEGEGAREDQGAARRAPPQPLSGRAVSARRGASRSATVSTTLTRA